MSKPSFLSTLSPFERAVIALLYRIERNTDPNVPDHLKGARQPVFSDTPEEKRAQGKKTRTRAGGSE